MPHPLSLRYEWDKRLDKNAAAVDVLNSNRQLWQMAGGADPDTLANTTELSLEQCHVTAQVLHSMLEKHGPQGGFDSFVEDIEKAVKMLRFVSPELITPRLGIDMCP